MKLVRTGLLALVAVTGATLSANAALLVCTGGPGMSIDTQIPGVYEVTFERAEQAANDETPPPGKCAMPEVPLPPGSSRTLAISKKNKDALRMLAAARGGSFTVEVKGQDGKLVVSSVANIVINDGGGGNGDDVVVEDDGGKGDAGNDDGDEQASMCGNPGDTATVVIDDPKFDKLNVRERPGGKVIGQVPEGDEVTLVGPCGKKAGAGIVADDAPSGWCQIDEPIAGCVKAEFLDIGGGFEDGAGIAAKKGKKN